MVNYWTVRIRQVKFALIIAAVAIAGISLTVSHVLISDLESEEHVKMEIWAEAMKSLISADGTTELSLVLKVLGSNHTIPVIVLDSSDNIIDYRNIPMNEDDDSLHVLKEYAADMQSAKNTMKMNLSTNEFSKQSIDSSDYITICYDESLMLKRLATYPYVQLAIMGLFILIAIYATLSSKKAEEHRIWVGLSRETAHQLGTPISSLMAWNQMLTELYPDDVLLPEMYRDVERLQLIAERFSKIGSTPEMQDVDMKDIVYQSINYIDKRTSDRIKFIVNAENNCVVKLCSSLLEWVFENLCKNAIDAMYGEGTIEVNVHKTDSQKVLIEICDSGKGIPKRDWKNVFRPGFTTKKRGWGLGLSLAKRIIEEYHKGKIYVSRSVLGKGTVFAIELPLHK